MKEYDAPYVLAHASVVSHIDARHVRGVRRVRGAALPDGRDRRGRDRVPRRRGALHRLRRLPAGVPERGDHAGGAAGRRGERAAEDRRPLGNRARQRAPRRAPRPGAARLAGVGGGAKARLAGEPIGGG